VGAGAATEDEDEEVAAELPIGDAAMRGEAAGAESGLLFAGKPTFGVIIGVTQVEDEDAHEEGLDGLKFDNTEHEATEEGGNFVEEDVV